MKGQVRRHPPLVESQPAGRPDRTRLLPDRPQRVVRELGQEAVVRGARGLDRHDALSFPADAAAFWPLPENVARDIAQYAMWQETLEPQRRLLAQALAEEGGLERPDAALATRVDAMPAEDMISGRVFRVRVQSDGYQRKEFAIRVEPGQTEVSIQAALAATTGGLRFTTGLPSVGFTINGSRYALSGDEARSLKELVVARGKPLDLRLPPGTYSLEAGSGKRVDSGRSRGGSVGGRGGSRGRGRIHAGDPRLPDTQDRNRRDGPAGHSAVPLG